TAGTGTFTQGSATATAFHVSIGTAAGSHGYYSLGGFGRLAVNNGGFNVGDAGIGTFNQTGSAVVEADAGKTVNVTVGNIGAGTYLHSGGILSAVGITLGNTATGTGTYNLSNTGVINISSGS